MAWWFGRKSAPEPVRALVPAWLRAASGGEFVRSYEAQFDEVYRNNPVGQRAVRLVSGLLGSLTVYAAEGDEKAAALVSAELVEQVGAALLLHGNAYVQLMTDAEEKPHELVLLRPERVTVETDAQGWPVAYKYRAGGRTVRLARTDGLGRTLITHVRSLHPRDDHYGMGCLDAAIAAASVHNRASRWNKALLDNAARPSEATPAYRGLAVAVFEHLQLAEFGNRIPFLTFEVEADADAVPVAAVLSDVSRGAIDSSAPSVLAGYAAHGETIAGAVQPLVEVFGIPLADSGSSLISPAPDRVDTADNEVGCSADSSLRPRTERTQVPARALPSALSLGYYDPSREYQAGLARAAIETSSAAADEKLDLPAVLNAAGAKGLAETSVARRWAERDRLTLRLPPAYLAVRPGTLVRPPDSADPWRTERVTVDSMAVIVELRPRYAIIDNVPADPGRVLPSLGVAPAPTDVAAFELPDDGSGSADAPVMAIATSAGGETRTVPIKIEIGDGEIQTRTVAARALVGTATTALGPGQSSVFDLLNSVDVTLARPAGWLESRDDEALANGANVAMIGNEIIQFGNALALGDGRFRLSRLLRGRRGSEWAIAQHQSGEPFVLLDPARLHRLELGVRHAGARIWIRPLGLADASHPGCEAIVSGEAMRPPSPVHLRAWQESAGALRCTWVRRSRQGWAWLDGVDAPLGCSTERYRVRLRGDAASVELETSAPEAQFSEAQIDPLRGAEAEISVMQVGDLALSRSTSVTISIS